MLLLAALVLAIVPVVSAQDTLGASQEDYDLWTAANANLAAVQTASYGFTANVTTTGMGESNINLNLTGTGVFDTNSASPQIQLDVTGSAQTTETTPINLSARFVNGTLYTNNNGAGWEAQTTDSLSVLGMPTDPSALSQNPMIGQLMSGLSGAQASEFLTLSSADQNGLKELTINVDVVKLVSSPAIAPLLGMTMGMMGGSGQQMTTQQLQQMQGMMAAMMGTAKVSFSELVDPATQQVQQITFTADVPLEMVGPGAAVSLNFQVNLSNFNQPVTVEVPATQAAGG
jgi:hypothetical protein